MTVSAAATGNPLPFTWELRRSLTTLTIYTNNDRFSFFRFVAPTTLTTNQPYRVVLTNVAGSVFAQFNMTTLGDTDRDGIPDAWETRYNFDATNSIDRDIDWDGDGLTNWQEYNAGTDPTNAASSLKISLAVSGAQSTLSFGAASNKTYTVQYSNQPGNGSWSKLADIFARTNNHVETVVDPNWTSNRFYRAVTPRQP